MTHHASINAAPGKSAGPSSDAGSRQAFGLPPEWGRGHLLKLFLASFLALYFELVIIRYLSTEIRVFAYRQNLPLIASFLGIGLGMVIGHPPRALRRVFPLVTAALFLVITFAGPLNLTHLSMPQGDYLVWGGLKQADLDPMVLFLQFFVVVMCVVALVVAFFVELGGIVGEELAKVPPLPGYGTNLAGSLAGILALTLLAFADSPPAVWLLIGFLVAVPFFLKRRLALVAFGLLVVVTARPMPDTFWSPYYRVSLYTYSLMPGWPHPTAYHIDVNHDYHQKMVDLSPAFIERFPDIEPNRSALPTYDLPYRLVKDPGDVLVVGAGTGNDVAAALRHGARHVDAVEIDPVIAKLGRKYHPEHPYDSPRVTVHVDDARAFFKKARQKYDLVVFGYLDSHTLISSYTSVRLDNYVYTVQSFREARRLLKQDGTLFVSFASGQSFVTKRLFATLQRVFGTPPRAYFTGYDKEGVVFVEGKARDTIALTDFPEVTRQLLPTEATTLPATDQWPFLYLKSRTIPYAILVILGPFLWCAAMLLHQTVNLTRFADSGNLHFFFLGAGFLLLETKGITELSLLFGSTWIVNAVVIGAFLVMAILANTLVMFRPMARRLAYVALFVLIGVGMLFPLAHLDLLPGAVKVLAAGALVGLPVFFSGLVFSRGFRDVADPSQALGFNLLGCVVGGILENAVMLAGTPILGALAVLLYALSAVCIISRRGGSREPQPANA
jgi:SAM-dependent methyltransferase